MSGMAVTIRPLAGPPVVGDLVVRPLAPGEAVPPGWTVVRAHLDAGRLSVDGEPVTDLDQPAPIPARIVIRGDQ